MGLILAMLCGCGQRQSVSAEKETDRIVIWTWDDTFNVKAAKLAAKEYKKTHKDIQIIVETKESSLSAFRIQISIAKTGNSTLRAKKPCGSPKSMFASANSPTNHAAKVEMIAIV